MNSKTWMYKLMFIFCIIFAWGCANSPKQTINARDSENLRQTSEEQSEVPECAAILIKAYPTLNLKYKNNRIYFTDGSSIVYDDGKEKNYINKLDYADIEDMFTLKYSLQSKPTYLNDGGRCRCDSFFMKIYGKNKSEVEQSLVNIFWFGKKIKITSINGVDKQLCKIRDEIALHPELKKYMTNSTSYYWRYVRGSHTRLSSHSYGITVDINTTYSDFWLWKNPKATETDKINYYNRIPLQIVRIFEKYGFIWGGAWYHFDTMHFEYRPEILMYARLHKI